MGGMNKRDFIKATGMGAVLAAIPVYAQADPGGSVAYWHYALFDFERSMGVCGIAPDGKRYAAKFAVPNTPDKLADKLKQAKALIEKRFAEGKGIGDDRTVEGNEEDLA